MTTRKKNALTQHFIAEDLKTPEYLRLANWIESIEPEVDENVEDKAYYSGDGTPEDDVISTKRGWSVDGTYDDNDPAHQLIRDLEFKVGEDRKVMYKQIRQDGKVLIGPATIKEPVTLGGPAEEFEPLQFTVTWDKAPTITEGEPVGPDNFNADDYPGKDSETEFVD